MDLLVIGDVHGCYYTLKKLVKKHWRPGAEVLIQAGDLINKGPHSIKCIQYWMQLEKTHSGQVCLLRGNHEQLLLDCIQKPHEDNPCYEVWRALIRSDLNLPEVESWLDELPLKWENPQLLITHAGWAKGKKDPYQLQASKGVLYNKGPLRHLAQTQVKGHSIVEGHKPVFNPAENAWYIDTGAWTKKNLSALRFVPSSGLPEVILVKTKAKDQVYLGLFK